MVFTLARLTHSKRRKDSVRFYGYQCQQYLEDSGLVYIGEWFEDQINGEGFISVPNEGVGQGQFKNNVLNGMLLFYTDNNASILEYSGGEKQNVGLEWDESGLYFLNFCSGELRLKERCKDLQLFQMKHDGFRSTLSTLDQMLQRNGLNDQELKVGFQLMDEQCYLGWMLNNQPFGLGVLNNLLIKLISNVIISKNKGIQQGLFESGLQQIGQIWFENRDKYFGEFQDGQMSGNGIYWIQVSDHYNYKISNLNVGTRASTRQASVSIQNQKDRHIFKKIGLNWLQNCTRRRTFLSITRFSNLCKFNIRRITFPALKVRPPQRIRICLPRIVRANTVLVRITQKNYFKLNSKINHQIRPKRIGQIIGKSAVEVTYYNIILDPLRAIDSNKVNSQINRLYNAVIREKKHSKLCSQKQYHNRKLSQGKNNQQENSIKDQITKSIQSNMKDHSKFIKDQLSRENSQIAESKTVARQIQIYEKIISNDDSKVEPIKENHFLKKQETEKSNEFFHIRTSQSIEKLVPPLVLPQTSRAPISQQRSIQRFQQAIQPMQQFGFQQVVIPQFISPQMARQQSPLISGRFSSLNRQQSTGSYRYINESQYYAPRLINISQQLLPSYSSKRLHANQSQQQIMSQNYPSVQFQPPKIQLNHSPMYRPQVPRLITPERIYLPLQIRT